MIDKSKQAFELFDAYNSKDPNVFEWESKSYPQEYFFALQLHKWVKVLNPNAAETLLLASRCQHIGRWEKPRNTYPDGKVGYLNWRKELGKYHAQVATDILLKVGYDNAVIERVQQIVLKQKIKVDADVQTMENALCLVFLEFQYENFFPQHADDKVIEIIRKSLLKMDAAGHAYALKLNYSAKGLELIKEALKLL